MLRRKDRMTEVVGGLHVFARRFNDGYPLYVIADRFNVTITIPASACRVNADKEITHIKESYVEIMKDLYNF